MTALEVHRLSKSFGGIAAVDDVSFTVSPGEIVGLIGPNGAGKTTLLNLISGLIPADSGRLRCFGRRIEGSRPDKIARMGVARTYQVPKPLRDLTVAENVMVGALFGSRAAKSTAVARELAMQALRQVQLVYQADASCQHISTGETKKMELARAITMDPRLLIADEPLAGVGVRESETLIGVITGLAKDGCAILMVEHAMNVVWEISDRVVVMHHGEKIADCAPMEAASNQEVIKAYLGQRYVDQAFARAECEVNE
jgi:branched-chain amino acid transport system ATP-binding protein